MKFTLIRLNILFLLLLLLSCSRTAVQEKSETNLDSLFKNSFEAFQVLRLEQGMYRDARLFEGTDFHPISIATTGMGLMALCIGQEMGWIQDGAAQAEKTLRSILGKQEGFSPERSKDGFFHHFLELNTGAQAWESEFSTIDTALLMTAVFFASQYFETDTLSRDAEALWNSIDFKAALKEVDTGAMFMKMNAMGGGDTTAVTLPYSEYMILAHLIKLQNPTSETVDQFWSQHYGSITTLPKSTYGDYELLTDQAGHYLSSFTHLFNYYFCSAFSSSKEYVSQLSSTKMADQLWWRNQSYSKPYWGHGAGSGYPDGYDVNAINNNPNHIVSPSIIAGYLAVYPEGKEDLLNLWNSKEGQIEWENKKILWRFIPDKTWKPKEIIGIDFGLMLFGLASLPEYLGTSFFMTHLPSLEDQ